MYVCVYVCAYVVLCVYVYICMCVHVNVCACVYVCVHVCMFMCIYVYACVCDLRTARGSLYLSREIVLMIPVCVPPNTCHNRYMHTWEYMFIFIVSALCNYNNYLRESIYKEKNLIL